MVSLKGLLDEPRGGAWPSSARAVRCPVKSGNERDLYPQLPAARSEDRAHCRDCLRKEEEGAGNDRSVCPESAGLHARNNVRDNGTRLRKEKLSLETLPKSGLRVVTHPHDDGIPSNRTLSASGEYVPAPCTHRPSNHSSGVWMRPVSVGQVESGFCKKG